MAVAVSPRARTIVLTDASTVTFTADLAAYDGTVPVVTPTPTPTPAPVFSEQPSISPTSGEVGQTFTADDGTASDVTGYTRRWLLSGVAIGTGVTVIPGAGALVLEVTASGPTGEAKAFSEPVTVAEQDGGTPTPTPGEAYPAGQLTRTSSAAAYPPTYTFSRPIALIDADSPQGVMQRSQDPTFASGISEVTRAILAAATSYDFGLSAITSGVWFWRLGFYKGGRPSDQQMNWSNIVGVGDAGVPAITSTAAPSAYQFVAGSLALTANKPSTWAIVGGEHAEAFTIAGNTLSWAGRSAAGTLDVQVQATSYFGVPSAVQNVALTVGVNTPTQFAFNDVADAATSTVYTSNKVKIAGLVGGAAVPGAIDGGSYSKNGGPYTSAPFTAVNGDEFDVRIESGATDSVTRNVVFTAGATSDTFTVATPGSTAVLSSAGGTTGDVNRSGYVDVSNGGFTATVNNNVGDICIVRSLSPMPAKAHFEVTTGAIGSKLWMGVVDASVPLGPKVYNKPGRGTSPGLSLNVNPGSTGREISLNGDTVYVETSAIAPGRIFSFDVDQAAKTVLIREKNGSTVTTVGTFTLTALIPTTWTACIGGQSAPDSLTVNFGASAWAIPPAANHKGW